MTACLPDGLSICADCGGVRGTEKRLGGREGATALCLCDGITCQFCGVGRVRRPISDWYDPVEQAWWHTPYFGAMKHCKGCRGPAAAPLGGEAPRSDDSTRAAPGEEGPLGFRVMVDDNFHFMDEDERYQAGGFDTYEEALARCREIVDSCLRESLQPGMTADALFDAYRAFGDDPWIPETPLGASRFSAWDHARERCRVLTDATGAE